MEFARKRFAVGALLENYEAGLLIRNQEYQRGATWDESQKRSLIDSLFRRYPIPPLFLYKKSIKSLGGGTSEKFEIVDGQQRLIALSQFKKGYYKLFEPNDSKFKVPSSVRSLPAPWAGRNYDELTEDLRKFFDEFEIDVQVIENVSNLDEVRDLFIRLQSGTALTPQQVRDAWPGNVGPYVERLAGKLQHRPSLQLFDLIDRRGTRSDDEDQKDVSSTTGAHAQLLRTYLARAFDPLNFVSISSKHLDALYHENTEFDPGGPVANAFKEVLETAEAILKLAGEEQSSSASQKKRKFRKVDVICLVAFLQDMQTNPNVKIDASAKQRLAEFLVAYEPVSGGKTTSGASLQENYKMFREKLPADALIRLDPKRLFDDDQRREIMIRENGLCRICKKPVVDDEVEIDHFPVAHARGGRTDVSNGRLVHKRCHPRYGALPA